MKEKKKIKRNEKKKKKTTIIYTIGANRFFDAHALDISESEKRVKRIVIDTLTGTLERTSNFIHDFVF